MNYKELSNVFKKISKWDSKKTKVLSIKTRPFNTIAVFSNIINKTICKNKNILYIFCNREKKYASEKIKELNNFVDGIIESEKLKDNFKYIFIEEISEVTEFYDLVIFDDISLEPGRLRLRPKGSAGGHNGIKSIIAHLGSDKFKRVKFGVGDKPKGWDLADWVLGKFPAELYPQLRDGNTRACEAVECIISEGIESAMNKFNG